MSGNVEECPNRLREKMVGNDWENCLEAQTCQNVFRIVSKCPKMSQDVPKCQKMSEPIMGENGRK